MCSSNSAVARCVRKLSLCFARRHSGNIASNISLAVLLANASGAYVARTHKAEGGGAWKSKWYLVCKNRHKNLLRFGFMSMMMAKQVEETPSS